MTTLSWLFLKLDLTLGTLFVLSRCNTNKNLHLYWRMPLWMLNLYPGRFVKELSELLMHASMQSKRGLGPGARRWLCVWRAARCTSVLESHFRASQKIRPGLITQQNSQLLFTKSCKALITSVQTYLCAILTIENKVISTET